MTRDYYLKPAGLYESDGWNGKKASNDFVGDGNYGTRSQPVKFSAGMMSWLIYQDEKVKDESDTSTSEHRLHFIGSGSGDVTTFWVGPQDWDGKRCQGADHLYLQKNPNRPNRKVRVIIDTVGRVELCYAPHRYTKEIASKWGGPVEGAVILSAPTSYLDYFSCQGITLNANFPQQGYPTEEDCKTRGYKLHGIQVRAQSGLLDEVKVINSGSTSATVGDYISNECFPINVYAMEPEEGAWLIRDCHVSHIHSINGGYFTAITPCMFTDYPGPRPEKFYAPDEDNRVPVRCLVSDCSVTGNSKGNGIGTAGTGRLASRGVAFRRCVIRSVAIAGNYDTGSIREQEITDCHFIDCCAGIQLGTPTGGVITDKKTGPFHLIVPDPMSPTFHRNFLIAGNHLSIGDQKVLLDASKPDVVHNAGLILRNNSAGIIWRDNHITSPYGLPYREVCPSGVDPYYPEYYGPSGPGNPCIDLWMRDPKLTREVKAS